MITRVTLTSGGSRLVITTPMVAKATYDKTRVAVVLLGLRSLNAPRRRVEGMGYAHRVKFVISRVPLTAGFWKCPCVAICRGSVSYSATRERPFRHPSIFPVSASVCRCQRVAWRLTLDLRCTGPIFFHGMPNLMESLLLVPHAGILGTHVNPETMLYPEKLGFRIFHRTALRDKLHVVWSRIWQ